MKTNNNDLFRGVVEVVVNSLFSYEGVFEQTWSSQVPGFWVPGETHGCLATGRQPGVFFPETITKTLVTI